jgi:hypothetical protein
MMFKKQHKNSDHRTVCRTLKINRPTSFKKGILIKVCLCYAILGACNSRPLKQALESAKNNKSELQKVLTNYRTQKNERGYQAATFLIENMPGHFSYDTTSLAVFRPALLAYDSLTKYRSNHPEFDLIEAMDTIWNKVKSCNNPYSKIYSQPALEDIKHISSSYLIDDIDLALETWQCSPYHDSIIFEDFRDFVLPYRKGQGLSVEEWRKPLYQENQDLLFRKSKIPITNLIDSVLFRYSDYTHTYGIMPDYPYLKRTDFATSKRGGCAEKCWLNTMLFSSLGIPVAIDFVPAWGNRNDRHQWNVLLYNSTVYPFESFWETGRWKYKKLYNNQNADPRYGDYRLAKVYRNTYKTIWEGPITEQLPENIPALFLNVKKKDVSNEYFETCDLELTLENKPPANTTYAYLCVFNAATPIPVQWGKIVNNTARFKAMGKDIVYVPAYYKNNRLFSAGNAFYLDKKGKPHFYTPHGQLDSVALSRKYPIYPLKENWRETLIGGKFQGANRSDFSDAEDLFIIQTRPQFFMQKKAVTSTSKYRYVRFLFQKGKYGNLAEVSFYTSINGNMEKLTGSLIHSDELNSKIIEKSFDDKIATFMLPYMPGRKIGYKDSWWVGLDLGNKQSISQVGYCPRTDRNNVFTGLNYELLYWSNTGWQSLGQQQAITNELAYCNVPDNSLFILRCLDEGKEERIFTIDNDKQRWH